MMFMSLRLNGSSERMFSYKLFGSLNKTLIKSSPKRNRAEDRMCALNKLTEEFVNRWLLVAEKLRN